MTSWRYGYVHEYLTYCRAVLAATENGRSVVLEYGGRPVDRAAFREQFRRALDHRINLKLGPYPSWRKLDDLLGGERASSALRASVERDQRTFGAHAPALAGGRAGRQPGGAGRDGETGVQSPDREGRGGWCELALGE